MPREVEAAERIHELKTELYELENRIEWIQDEINRLTWDIPREPIDFEKMTTAQRQLHEMYQESVKRIIEMEPLVDRFKILTDIGPNGTSHTIFPISVKRGKHESAGEAEQSPA